MWNKAPRGWLIQGLHQIEGPATLHLSPLPCPPVTALPVVTKRWLQTLQPSHPGSMASLVCKESLSWESCCLFFTCDSVSRPKAVLEWGASPPGLAQGSLSPRGPCGVFQGERLPRWGLLCHWQPGPGSQRACLRGRASLVLEKPPPCSCFMLGAGRGGVGWWRSLTLWPQECVLGPTSLSPAPGPGLPGPAPSPRRGAW